MPNLTTPTQHPTPTPPDPPLSTAAHAMAAASKAANTRRAYAAQLTLWHTHCEETGLTPYPAAPAAVANWLTARAEAGQALSTIRTALAALSAGHQAQGLPFDARAPILRAVLAGIARTSQRTPDQAAPLRASQVAALLEGLSGDPISLRDGATIALGFLFAARRSELVGLDFTTRGTGDGILTITATTIEVTLYRSKTASLGGEPERVSVPRAPVATAVASIERWLAWAQIQPGAPVLRRVYKSGRVGPRLTAQSVAAIVRRRIYEYLRATGVPHTLAEAEARTYSGHSLRVGFATSAAEAGADVLAIATVTRHRSLGMVQRYTRRAESLRQSPFRRDGMQV